MYFDLGMLRIRKTYVKLEEDIHVASILRINKKITIKPQTAVVCNVKLSNGFQIPESGLIEINNVDSDCIQDEPGLVVQEAVNQIDRQRKTSVMIVNRTNRSYNIKRGSVICKARALQDVDVCSIERTEEQQETMEYDLKELKVPPEHKQMC